MRLVLSLIAILAAAPASAVEILHCSLGETHHGWVARTLVLAHEPGKREAVIADEIGLYFSGKPTTARVTSDTSRSLRFNWSVPKVKDSRGNVVPAMIYRATLSRRNGGLKVTAEPLGYSVRFSGSGTCRDVSEDERKAIEKLVQSAG